MAINILKQELIKKKTGKQQQLQQQVQEHEGDDSHKGENRHSKNTEQVLDKEYPKADFKSENNRRVKKSNREQLILLKQNKQTIIDLIIDNKNSIKIEILKIYEPVYKCYREKGNCYIYNSSSNIICKS